MNEIEMVNVVKQSPQILLSIYSDLAQPSVRKVGQALETVFEFSTSFLLPLKLLNEKFKVNFEKNLNSYKEKIESISEEELCIVDPQIGTPIIERLTYTTNEEIADLFTSLLAKASSFKTSNLAHPSFVQMIERLSVDEARIIKSLYNKEEISYVTFRAHIKDEKGFIEVVKNGTMLSKDIELIFPQNTSLYQDNLVSIGVLDNSHGLWKIDDQIYDPLIKVYGYEKINEELLKTEVFSKVEIKKGFYQITEFGKTFIKACISLKD